MNPIEIIDLHKDSFTKKEIKIRDYIIDNLDDVAINSLVGVAKKINVSKSSLLRFCQKIGYSGYSEFKYDVSRFLYSGNIVMHDGESISNFMIDQFVDTLQQIKTIGIDSLLDNLAKLILSSGKIRIFGIHESGLSAKQLQFRLLTVGVDSESITDTSIMFEKVNLTKDNDLNIFFSISGTNDNIVDIMNEAIGSKTKTALITANFHSQFRDSVDSLIILPRYNVDKNTWLIDFQVLNFIIIELLLNTIGRLQRDIK